MDGSGSWWGEHWSEVVAVVLAGGFLALVGTAVRSSLMLGQASVNRRVRNRRASDTSSAATQEWRSEVQRLERRVAVLEAAIDVDDEASRGDEGEAERSVLAKLSSAPTDVAAEVERLAREGHSTEAIARRLGEPVGRIELIRNLRRASGQS